MPQSAQHLNAFLRHSQHSNLLSFVPQVARQLDAFSCHSQRRNLIPFLPSQHSNLVFFFGATVSTEI
jgi:hypothetical protein